MPVSALLTLAEAKAALNITDDDQDAELADWVDRLTPIIEAEVGPIVQRDVTATIPAGAYCHALPWQTAVAFVSGVEVDGGAVVSTTNLRVDRGILSRTDGSTLGGRLWTLTLTVGITEDEVPTNIRQAASEALVAAWALRRNNSGELPTFILSYRVQAWLKPDATPLGFA